MTQQQLNLGAALVNKITKLEVETRHLTALASGSLQEATEGQFNCCGYEFYLNYSSVIKLIKEQLVYKTDQLQMLKIELEQL